MYMHASVLNIVTKLIIYTEISQLPVTQKLFFVTNIQIIYYDHLNTFSMGSSIIVEY